MGYVELHAHSAYSFLDGASLPEELALRAAELGYGALALTDHDGVYGSLEFAQTAKAFGVRPITGAEVTLAEGSHVTLLVESAAGYANLCRLLTAAHSDTRVPGRERELLDPALPQELLEERNEGLVCLSGCARHGLAVRNPNAAARLAQAFGRDRFFVELQRPFERGDARRNSVLRELAAALGVATVATGDVHAHDRRLTALQDALVAVKNRTSLDGCEAERRGNRESFLRPPAEIAELFPHDRDAVERSGELAEQLRFDLNEDLGYRYPDFSENGEPAIAQLARVCDRAFAERYSGRNGHRRKARARLDEELKLIDELGLAGFFLLHWEVLELARELAVEVDIDLDFPRDIREKLLPAVSDKYGREHAALVAAFPTYNARGAIRDVGMALGLPHAELERLARITEGNPRRVAEEVASLPDAETKLRSPRWRAFCELCREIGGLPRHASQHPGGMVISSRPLVELVPVMPAAMAGRQLVQWDKDSCADAGFLKIDLLGLGMLSAVEECVELIAERLAEPLDLSRIPLHDPDVYADIQRADTVGVFQIESRAQMQSLLRTRPETLDDLTVQVALVRPGPIQGKAVHPYIEHRERLRQDLGFVPPVDHPLLAEPLQDTLGVVVFQDQVLEVAMALAGFSVGEAEGLRRAMSRKRSEEAIEAYRTRFIAGAIENGVEAELADLVYDKLAGFSGFGFPKSHAAAFGLLAYQSTWLRHHYPSEFLAALLNAQPMGFYPPASLVRDAQRRGVEVRPVDVNRSAVKCTLEGDAVRIGLDYVQSLGEPGAKAVVEERERRGSFAGVRELAQRVELDRSRLEALVASGACDAFGERRQLLWELGLAFRPAAVPGSGGEARQLTLSLDAAAATPELPEQTPWERMLADYRLTSLSVGTHPMALLRPRLPAEVVASRDLGRQRHGGRIAVAGLAVARQRPATANGVVFMLLEDEFGQVNLIVPPPVYQRFRPLVRAEPLVLARGRFESRGRNQNVLVHEFESLVPLAKEVANGADVFGSLPAAHHFGHR
ncbi:MAG: PHP domain-containing protein [Actinobacteria bacterium]|nr:MAG: PHP domain-containing protein [Actinomycetota bacterium]